MTALGHNSQAAWVLLVVLAFINAVISGALGMGGGSLFVGSLRLVLPTQAAVVFVHATVQLVSNFSRTLAYWHDVRWRQLAPFLIPCALTPPLGLWLLQHGGEGGLTLTMGVFLLAVPWFPNDARVPLSPRLSMVVAGTIAGAGGMLIGATGLVVAPFFRAEGMDRRGFVGTKALAQAAGHVVKVAWFLALGRELLPGDAELARLGVVIAVMAGATVVGTVVGERWARGMAEQRFVAVFRVVVGGLGLVLVGQAGRLLGWW